MSRGIFAVIDGSDGSGKGTQYALFQERLRREGIAFAPFDFPQYGQPSAYFVEQYLNGRYGGVDEVPPERGSVFFALDRYAASFAIRAALDEGKVVIANRFTTANLAHQGAKIRSSRKRRDFFIDIETFEHERMNIPRPDCNIILQVPAELGQQNVDKKAARSYVQNKRDIHEEDLDFLKRSVAVYQELCELFPDAYSAIDCMEDSTPSARMKSPEAIHELIWKEFMRKMG